MIDWRSALQTWITKHSKVIPPELAALRQEFVTRFPKEILTAMTLEDYALGHPDRPDSFCHWIEFKTRLLGSIAGGSSSKHGIYWSESDQNWRVNKSLNAKNPEEALKILLNDLEELIKAVDTQDWDNLDQIADSRSLFKRYVCRAKIISLYFPEYFIPVLAVEHLRQYIDFFGIKSPQTQFAMNRALLSFLQSKPEFNGFDSCSMMKFLYSLGITQNPESTNTTRYWKISPGENAWQWDDCRNQGFIAIGWNELGDISDLSKAEFEQLRDQLIVKNPNFTKQQLNQVWQFAQIKLGDRIIANQGTRKILGLGTVTEQYFFVLNERHGHRLRVDWDAVEPLEVDYPGWQRTLLEIKPEEAQKFESSFISNSMEYNCQKFWLVKQDDSWDQLLDRQCIHIPRIINSAKESKNLARSIKPGDVVFLRFKNSENTIQGLGVVEDSFIEIAISKKDEITRRENPAYFYLIKVKPLVKISSSHSILDSLRKIPQSFLEKETKWLSGNYVPKGYILPISQDLGKYWIEKSLEHFNFSPRFNFKPRRASEANYFKTWIFHCDPDFFDIDQALLKLNQLVWQVKQHYNQIKKGDLRANS